VNRILEEELIEIEWEMQRKICDEILKRLDEANIPIIDTLLYNSMFEDIWFEMVRRN